MSNTYGAPPIPPAWYPDPQNQSQLRWWDGHGWTDQVAPAAVTAPVPVPTAFGSPFATPFSAPVPVPEPVVTEPPAYVPMSRVDVAGAPTSKPLPPSYATSTPWIWIFVIAPIVLIPEAFFGLELSDLLTTIIRAVIVLAFFALAIVSAAFDRSTLHKREFIRAPSGSLGALPPIFLLARTAVVGPRGVPALLAGLAVQALVAAFLVVQLVPALVTPAPEPTTPLIPSTGMVAPYSAQQRAFILTPEGMAQKILYDTQSEALSFESVTCEPLPSSALGEQTTCTAVGSLLSYTLTVQSLGDESAEPFDIVSTAPVLGG